MAGLACLADLAAGLAGLAGLAVLAGLAGPGSVSPGKNNSSDQKTFADSAFRVPR